MAMETAATVLNRLAALAQEGREGCSEAAQQTADEELKQILAERAAEYEQTARELRYAAKALGPQPEAPAVGGVESWAKVISTVTNPNASVLEAVERGESRSLQAYEQALQGGLPPAARSVVERQYRGLLDRRERARRLRDRFKMTG